MANDAQVQPVATTSDAHPSPLDTILQTSGGYCVARALHAVADAGIADLVGEQPRSVREIAEAGGTDADALERILRLLSAHDIFTLSHGQVAHNAASLLLRSDHPQSARDLARMFGLPFLWQAFEAFEHTLRTGRPAIEQVHPDGLWDWLAQRPEANAVFNGAMISKSYGQVAGVVESFDFSRFARVADIGGGRGHLLQAILQKWAGLRGILFDLPHVIADVRDLASDRLELRGGDFFADELPSADAYVLMEVIHDWPDAESERILSAVARAAPAGASLLLIEQLMPDTPGPHWVKMLDIHMMALFAARQRGATEYDSLAQRAGFSRTGVTDTAAGISILEYRRD